MSTLRDGCLACTCLLTTALLIGCGNDQSGEDLPDGGFTTGIDPSTGSGLGGDSSTGGGSTTDTTADPTSNGTNPEETTTGIATDTGEGVTGNRESSDTTVSSDPSDTTESSSGSAEEESTTGAITSAEDTSTGGAETNAESSDTDPPPPPECGNGTPEAGEVCFSDATPFATNATDLRDVVAGDFNGDGNQDVAAIGGSNEVSVLLGDGDGGLGAPATIGIGNDPVRIAAGRLNADNLDDLVVLCRGAGEFQVLLALAAGGFNAPVGYDVGATPQDLAIGDMTNDGRPEVIVGNGARNNFNTALNNGQGAFTVLPTAYAPANPANIPINGVALINGGNGPALDALVMGGPGPANNAAAISNSNLNDAAVNVGISYPLAAGAGARRASAERIANPRFAVAINDGGVVYFDNSPAANRIAATQLPAAAAGATAATLGDVTGDGAADIVASNGTANVVRVFVFGNPTFSTAPVAVDTGAGPSGVAVADLNDDGVGDIISSLADDTISVALSDP